MGIICLQYSILCICELVLAVFFGAFHPMNHKKEKIYLFIALGILAVMTMFHGQTVGNDTSNYISMFNRIANTNPLSYIKGSSTEAGFIMYCWLLSRVSSSPQILFIASGFFVYFSIGRFLLKNIDSPGIFCFLAVAMKFFDFFISAQRQGMSIAILLFAFEYLKEKKTLKFVTLAVLAVLFHNTAVAFILVYFVIKVRFINLYIWNITSYIKWFVGVSLCFLFFQRIWNILLRIFPKYLYYSGGALVDGEPRLAIVLKIAVYSAMFILSMLFATKVEEQQELINLFTVLSLINLSITIIAWNATAINRLCADFMIFPVLLYTKAINSEKGYYQKNHLLLVLITVVLFFVYGFVIAALKTPDWYTTYPFVFWR